MTSRSERRREDIYTEKFQSRNESLLPFRFRSRRWSLENSIGF
ncbi:hypothetical protein LINPERPRIM_LOCUS30661 [Linum perenne]